MAPINFRRAHLIVASAASFAVAAVTIHCGSESNSSSAEASGTASNGAGAGAGLPVGSNSSTATGDGGSFFLDVEVKDYSADAFFAEDPPPLSCDGGGVPPKPGGTPECPDDKNLEGCPCDEAGKTAPCWPGYRKNRNRGVCHDGVTKCIQQSETALAWGACEGFGLPTGTTGKEACLCFSGGQWKLDNTSPCFFDTDGTGSKIVAVSTTLDANGAPKCPANADAAPAADWSANRLSVDCTGHFKLCYTIKAGDAKNPKSTDCSIITVCSEAQYTQANVVQEFPPLPGWLAPDSTLACVKQFRETGGYGEMSVDGQSDECEGVKSVFQRLEYCPLACNKPPVPDDLKALCDSCKPNASGEFGN